MRRRDFLTGFSLGVLPLPVMALASGDPGYEVVLPSVVDTIAETESIRSIGGSGSSLVIREFFSLTCGDCADFALNVFPLVRRQLIETGKVFFVFQDFPLDEKALLAAQIARSLPSAHYFDFVQAVFSDEAVRLPLPGLGTRGEFLDLLFPIARSVGMPRSVFDGAVTDTGLRAFILSQVDIARRRFGVRDAPSFLIDGRLFTGSVSYPQFRGWIAGGSPVAGPGCVWSGW